MTSLTLTLILILALVLVLDGVGCDRGSPCLSSDYTVDAWERVSGSVLVGVRVRVS